MCNAWRVNKSPCGGVAGGALADDTSDELVPMDPIDPHVMLCAEEMDTSSSEAGADDEDLFDAFDEPFSALARPLPEGERGAPPNEGIVLLTVRYLRGSITC